MKVVLPSYRTRKVTVMSFRSDADIQAAKAQAARLGGWLSGTGNGRALSGHFC